MKDKIFMNYKPSGVSTLDVRALVKLWSTDFSITHKDGRYHLNYVPEDVDIDTIKTIISEEQAKDVISQCQLLRVPPDMFRHGTVYQSRERIEKVVAAMKEEMAASRLITILKTLSHNI